MSLEGLWQGDEHNMAEVEGYKWVGCSILEKAGWRLALVGANTQLLIISHLTFLSLILKLVRSSLQLFWEGAS